MGPSMISKNSTSLWQLTRDHESGAKLPKAVIEQISDTINTLADAENEVRSARNAILDLQATIAQEKSGVDEMISKVQAEINKRTKGVYSIDSPPLWKAFGAGGDRGSAREQFTSTRKAHWRALKDYVAEQGGRFLFWVLLWPALIAADGRHASQGGGVGPAGQIAADRGHGARSTGIGCLGRDGVPQCDRGTSSTERLD